MIVLTLTDCPDSLRGDITKWLVEINTGVFVGRVSARVRDRLWDRVRDSIKSGRATLVYSAQNEQRMDFRVHNSAWEPIDFDGIKLMMRPDASRAKTQTTLKPGYSKASQYRRARR
jgi:CRISPR-associated protein Cas2